MSDHRIYNSEELFADCQPVMDAGGPQAFITEVEAEAHRLVSERAERYCIIDPAGLDRLRHDVVGEVLSRRLHDDLHRELREAQLAVVGDVDIDALDEAHAQQALNAQLDVLEQHNQRLIALREAM